MCFLGGKILLNSGSAVDYDWLVLSMGSESSTMGIPGVKEHAILFNTIQDALQARLSGISKYLYLEILPIVQLISV